MIWGYIVKIKVGINECICYFCFLGVVDMIGVE